MAQSTVYRLATPQSALRGITPKIKYRASTSVPLTAPKEDKQSLNPTPRKTLRIEDSSNELNILELSVNNQEEMNYPLVFEHEETLPSQNSDISASLRTNEQEEDMDEVQEDGSNINKTHEGIRIANKTVTGPPLKKVIKKRVIKKVRRITKKKKDDTAENAPKIEEKQEIAKTAEIERVEKRVPFLPKRTDFLNSSVLSHTLLKHQQKERTKTNYLFSKFRPDLNLSPSTMLQNPPPVSTPTLTSTILPTFSSTSTPTQAVAATSEPAPALSSSAASVSLPFAFLTPDSSSASTSTVSQTPSSTATTAAPVAASQQTHDFSNMWNPTSSMSTPTPTTSSTSSTSSTLLPTGASQIPIFPAPTPTPVLTLTPTPAPAPTSTPTSAVPPVFNFAPFATAATTSPTPVSSTSSSSTITPTPAVSTSNDTTSLWNPTPQQIPSSSSAVQPTSTFSFIAPTQTQTQSSFSFNSTVSSTPLPSTSPSPASTSSSGSLFDDHSPKSKVNSRRKPSKRV